MNENEASVMSAEQEQEVQQDKPEELRIWEDKKAGMTVLQIAEKYNIHKNTVTKRARKGAEIAGEKYESPKAKTRPKPKDVQPPAKGAATPEKQAADNTEALLTGLIQTMHAGLSYAMKNPALNVSEEEARMIAQPLTQVLNEYNVIKSEKAVMWSTLLGAIVAVELPRIMLVVGQKKPQPQRVKEAKEETTTGTVSIKDIMAKRAQKVATGVPVVEDASNAGKPD